MRYVGANRLLGIVLLLTAVGCGTVRSHREFEQPLGAPLVVGVGGVVVRMNKMGDLPNAFGGRDVWGGKVSRGFAEIRLVAVDGATLVLDVIDVSRQSSETTMDRYEPFARTGVVDVEVNQSVNVSSDSGPAPQRVHLDTTLQRDFVIAGIRVAFLDVQPYGVRYVLEDSQPR